MDDKNASKKKVKAETPAPRTDEPSPVGNASDDASNQGVGYTMPKKSGFKAWMVIVPVAVLAVIAGVVILLVILLAGPSKKDYTQALDHTRETRRNYSSLNTEIRGSMRSLSSTTTTDSGAEDITSSLRKALDTYKDSVDTLQKDAALKDEEVSTSYDKLKTKSEAMTAYASGLLEGLPTVSKIARSCDTLTKGSSVPADSAFDTCQSALAEGKKLKVDELRKISEARSEFTRKMQDYAKVARKGSALDKLKARSQYMRAQSTYLSEAREQQRKLTDLDKKNNVSDEINDLGRLLTRKVNEA